MIAWVYQRDEVAPRARKDALPGPITPETLVEMIAATSTLDPLAPVSPSIRVTVVKLLYGH